MLRAAIIWLLFAAVAVGVLFLPSPPGETPLQAMEKRGIIYPGWTAIERR